ncbi:MAG: sulfotransferase [Chloroflexi bacterium]|nr:sulfotransferase [Chloroflexota bacterium]MYD47310.1 sulfotransferase [Chloroflexota bacterium]
MTTSRTQTGSRGYNPAARAYDKPGFSTGFNSFLATGRLGLALRLGFRYGVDRRFIPRYLGLLAADTIFAPLRVWQSVAYGRRIREAEIHPEPIFLLGFWRSGTTLLHNLLAMDPQWGFVNTYQAALPDVFLAGQRRVRRMIESRLPVDRGVDNIPVDLAMPQEEEIALMCSSGLSPYVSLNFPRTADETLEYLFPGDGLSSRNRERWQAEYIKLLKAASFYMDGKPLVLKSPSNTSRIGALLKLFPKARFVYLQRNPYDTLRSYVRLLGLMNGWHALQSVDFDELLLRQVKIYRRMAEAYLEQREMIPEGRLVELRYEELERDKMGQVRLIYEALGLEGYDGFEPRLEEYVASIADFQKNPTHISPQVIKLVNEYVPFLVSQYGYEFMDTVAVDAGGVRDTI